MSPISLFNPIIELRIPHSIPENLKNYWIAGSRALYSSPFTHLTADTSGGRALHMRNTSIERKVVHLVSWIFSAYMLFNRPVVMLPLLGVMAATKWYYHPSQTRPSSGELEAENERLPPPSPGFSDADAADELSMRAANVQEVGDAGEEANSPSFELSVCSRPGKESIPISIKIADIRSLELTRENLGEIFRRINEQTLQVPYPIASDKVFKCGQTEIYRPNHNGTHSARQVMYLEAMFDFLEKKGSGPAKRIYDSLNEEEKLHLLLGAYFFRAGRVDESGHGKGQVSDDYQTRSSMIYQAYANQVCNKASIVDWVIGLIANSKPENLRESGFGDDAKNRFGYEVLSMAHDLDLIRCHNQNQWEKVCENMKRRLEYFTGSSSEGDGLKSSLDSFIQYALRLCRATGFRIQHNPDFSRCRGNQGNRDLFVRVSLDGNECWKCVQKPEKPTWE